MGANFVTIDFETATVLRNSPCEIGLTVVEDSAVKSSHSWLIRPEGNRFDARSIAIHGITPAMVENEPEFDRIWEHVYPLVAGRFLIAHNAAFDFSVLRKTFDTYSMPYPNLQYGCSYNLSKRVWPTLPRYSLNALCSYLGIEFQHHRAESDSLATAEMMLRALQELECESIDELFAKANIIPGEISQDSFKAPHTIPPRKEYKKRYRYVRTSAKEIVGDPTKQKPDSIFFERTVVFSGEMSSMSRVEAFQCIADIGGFPADNLTKATDFLIVGQQDYRVVGEDGMSSKQKKAIKMVENGAELEIMSEQDFLQNL